MSFALPPDELKLIRPLIHRGNQMSGRDPVITYYCFYWAVSTAIGKGLHKVSPECKAYMGDLMQELESRKEQMTDNDLVTDQMAAQAYVENFANRIFGNASKAVDAGTANEKTPDALQAAATFLEVTKIWEESDSEVSKKIKYAKFHAARILKALKEGRDPNPPKAPATPPITEQPPPEQTTPPPPTVDEVPDEFYSLRQPTPSSLEPSAHPPPTIEDLHPSTPPQTEDYFPSVPATHGPTPQGSSPFPMGPPETQRPPSPPIFRSSPPAPRAAPSFPPPPIFQSSPPAPRAAPSFPPPPPTAPSFPSAPQPASSPFASPPPSAPLPFGQAPFAPPPPSLQSQNPYETPSVPSYYQHQQAPPPAPPTVYRKKKELSPEDIAKAQKYAKWAISALDYDDIENAIEQFRKGLETLGVQ